MGTPRGPQKIKLFAGILSGDEALLSEARSALTGRFGRIDYESPVLEFTHTDYYNDEMGRGLKKVFFGFKRLLSLKNIYSVKIHTNIIEKRFAVRGKRRVNIDPGYMDLAKVVLFTTKDYSHRVYIDNGIFAEVTLFYKNGRYNAWPWTYPDYRSESYTGIFQELRDIYKKQLAD